MRFDGTTWLQYSTANGLANDYVNQLVHDDQGRMWILNESGLTRSKLSVFDGVTWTTPAIRMMGSRQTSTTAHSLPTAKVESGSASSTSDEFRPEQCGHVRVNHWTFFGTAETNGQLTGPITGFTEMSDGSVWIGDGNHIAIYKDGAWSHGPTISSSGWIAADSHDNLWHVTSDSTAAGALNVLWRGLDYAFENGRWLSPTRFQASYTFTVDVPPGSFVVELAGATGSDGMPSAPTSIGSFVVDFGPAVSLDPPDPPAVSARTDGSLTTLYAFWQSSSKDIRPIPVRSGHDARRPQCSRLDLPDRRPA